MWTGQLFLFCTNHICTNDIILSDLPLSCQAGEENQCVVIMYGEANCE